jgi:3-hydroxyacyl-CoA dehydrogenase/enoyl-CoA hydratase/3-hydroxybutyryl-CoA epimerase/3-hydroxyacyl-CoA dehydrogenase/enoyl-CoA hydratase/3-hydroxybutyryl-CoA epimerase/enoyl-CoA isomerase
MASAQTIQISFPEPDIALLTLDRLEMGANVLSSSVLDELDSHLTALESRRDLAGLVITSGKPGTFIAGADLREFAASLEIPREKVVEVCRRGQLLFGRLAEFPGVTVAAVDGSCFGGGAELAIWCDRRVFSTNERTEFGFPEVKLGLFPGWGGTVRTPRIAGTANAVEMITSGESLSATEAAAMEIASDLVPPDDLLPASIRMIRAEQNSRDYLADRQQLSQRVDISDVELGFLGATASAIIRQQTKGDYPAPDAALETILEGTLLDASAACQLEATNMARLFGSPVNAALLNVFFLTDRNKKDTGIESNNISPREIGSVGVIGAGIMGAGIAAANVRRMIPAVISDASKDALARGVQAVIEEAAYDRASKGPTTKKMAEVAPLVNMTHLDAELAGCDLVIEAIVENVDVKRSVYARLEPQLRDNAILASNTSTIPIEQLAAQLKHPERFCGIHFFNPVRRMKLVEVIRGPRTDDSTVATAVAYAKRIGKMPIVVNDGPGFLVNRLLFPYMAEAIEMMCEGVEIKAIERAAKAFGMPMGPIELYDMVGIDTACYAGRTMVEAFPERIPASPLLPAMVKSGRLGQKSGRGFYRYDNKRKRAQPDPELGPLLQPYIQGQQQLDQETIMDRLFLPMLLEATFVLEAGIVRHSRDIDLGLIFGLGFPAFKGGLMFWADTVGADSLLKKLERFESIGERMRPTEMLRDAAAKNRSFYAI